MADHWRGSDAQGREVNLPTEVTEVELQVVLQEKEIDYLKNSMGTEMNVLVYGEYVDGPNDSYVVSYLIPRKNIDAELNNSAKSDVPTSPGFMTINHRTRYVNFSTSGEVEPLVIKRDYNGLAENTIEVVEEFRLLFQLFYDNKTGCYKDLKSNTNIVIIQQGKVFINQRYLRLYLAAKKKILVVFKDNRIFFQEDELYKEITDKKLIAQEEIGEDFRYKLTIGKYPGEQKYFSLLYEKKIILPLPLKGSGIGPYEKKKIYARFKIGWDKNCKDIEYSCDPKLLRDYFGHNESAPHYMTPVFFRKEVLNKYCKDDRYEVQDGMLRFGTLWSIYIDNIRNDEYVSVYLGDLGTYLPDYEEQQYWYSFNVVCDAKLSDVKYKRDFLAQATDPTDYLNRFKNKYRYIKKLTQIDWGWSLYKELSEEDEYVFRGLYIPSDTSQNELDNATLLLNKLMNDVINDTEIKKVIRNIDPTIDFENIKGTINLLEKLFELKGLTDYKDEIKRIRNIQDLRSSGSCHPKGKNYKKVRKNSDQDEYHNSDAYRLLLKEAHEFLCYVEKNIDYLK